MIKVQTDSFVAGQHAGLFGKQSVYKQTCMLDSELVNNTACWLTCKSACWEEMKNAHHEQSLDSALGCLLECGLYVTSVDGLQTDLFSRTKMHYVAVRPAKKL